MTKKRDHLQDIALEHVRRKGLKGLSFRTLAEEAGIKSSSVHYYFPEKSDLAEVLIERYGANMARELEAISAHESWSLRKKITAFIKIFEAVAKDDAVCLCGMLAAEYDNLNEKNCHQLNSFFADTEKWLVSQLNMHKDELNTEISSAQLSRAMLAGLEGALLIDRVAGNNQYFNAQKAIILGFLR